MLGACSVGRGNQENISVEQKIVNACPPGVRDIEAIPDRSGNGRGFYVTCDDGSVRMVTP